MNIALQLTLGPRATACKALIVVLLCCILFKFFYFLRIEAKFSSITTMLVQCAWKLKLFLTFFSVLLAHFGLMMSVLGPNP